MLEEGIQTCLTVHVRTVGNIPYQLTEEPKTRTQRTME